MFFTLLDTLLTQQIAFKNYSSTLWLCSYSIYSFGFLAIELIQLYYCLKIQILILIGLFVSQLIIFLIIKTCRILRKVRKDYKLQGKIIEKTQKIHTTQC